MEELIREYKGQEYDENYMYECYNKLKTLNVQKGNSEAELIILRTQLEEEKDFLEETIGEIANINEEWKEFLPWKELLKRERYLNNKD